MCQCFRGDDSDDSYGNPTMISELPARMSSPPQPTEEDEVTPVVVITKVEAFSIDDSSSSDDTHKSQDNNTNQTSDPVEEIKITNKEEETAL